MTNHQLEFKVKNHFRTNNTGSEYCLFHPDLALSLGIDIESGIRVDLSTLGGRLYAYAHTVRLDTFGITFESSVLFSTSSINRNILGRISWLDNLHLALTMDDEMIYLNPAYSE